MGNPIQAAREKVAKVLGKLPPKGIRNDHSLILRRLPDENSGASLSMMPGDEPSGPDLCPPLTIPAPKVSLYSGFGYLALAQGNGGDIRVGDHKVKFPRTAEVEAFLNACFFPTSDPTRLYAEMEFVLFKLNGEMYQPVRWLEGAIFLEVYIRKVD